jgi:uncharacterized protein YjbI with pentapeptide repeats
MEHFAKHSEIWARLLAGRPLDGLDLPVKDGRFDLSGWTTKTFGGDERRRMSQANADVLRPTVDIKGVTWRSIDFSASDLPHLRFIDCRLEDCIFDRSMCNDWRIWATVLDQCTLRGADLRGSSLGAVSGATRNVYSNTDFRDADLRNTSYIAAVFKGCRFENAKIKRIDFESSTFVDCAFAGSLDEVVFSRHGYEGEHFPPNEMLRIDMRRAKLRHVEFRNLDLDDVLLPDDEDHLVIDQFPAVLDEIISRLRAGTSLESQGLADYFSVFRRWAGRRGVVNKRALLRIAGEHALADVLAVIGGRSGAS